MYANYALLAAFLFGSIAALDAIVLPLLLSLLSPPPPQPPLSLELAASTSALSSLLPIRLLLCVGDNFCHALCSLFQYVLFQNIISHERRHANNDKDNSMGVSVVSCSSIISINSLSPMMFMQLIPNVSFREVLMSLLFGSWVDLDHFLAAGSLSLIDATSLARRPVGHCLLVGLPVVISMFLLMNKVVFKGRLDEIVKYQMIIGYISHITRDSTKRGLWIWFGVNTHLVPLPLYFAIFLILPFIYYGCLSLGGRGDVIAINSFLGQTKTSLINALDNV